MESLYACLDYQAVATGIYWHPKGTSANTLQKCIDYLEIWNNCPSSHLNTHFKPGSAFVLWVTGHKRILENKIADREALRGANLPLKTHARQMSIAGAKQWAHTTANQEFSTYQNSQPAHHCLRPDCACSQSHAELQLPQKSFAARSGHPNFEAYHTRFNHSDAEKRCRCWALTITTHFYYCSHSSHKELLRSKHGQLLTIKEILETAEGALAFSQWEETSNFFKISSRPR